MKAECINNKYCNYLTIGKIYEVIDVSDSSIYLIIDTTDQENCYPKSYFKPLLEMRNEMRN